MDIIVFRTVLDDGRKMRLSVYFDLLLGLLSPRFITPPSAARGGLKENGQNPGSGSKNSENQNNDALL